jgi:hypothetical protein
MNSSFMVVVIGRFSSLPPRFHIYGTSLIYLASSPFVQRVWIALEAKGLPYQYVEVDQLKKPQALLDINNAGLVPALRSNNFSMSESTVLLEYVCIIYFCYNPTNVLR